jgi:hypothetical protein
MSIRSRIARLEKQVGAQAPPEEWSGLSGARWTFYLRMYQSHYTGACGGDIDHPNPAALARLREQVGGWPGAGDWRSFLSASEASVLAAAEKCAAASGGHAWSVAEAAALLERVGGGRHQATLARPAEESQPVPDARPGSAIARAASVARRWAYELAICAPDSSGEAKK